MKNLVLIILLLMLACLSSNSATVTFTLTNSVTGNPDTNRIKIFPIASYINADGTVQTTGLPFTIQPNSSGFVATNLLAGNYLATNGFIVSQYNGPGNFGTSQGVIFAVPATGGTYPFGLLAISGYNVFNYSGANLTNGVTVLGISNALGFVPLSPQDVTNLFVLGTTNRYVPGTNITSVTNGNVITWQVPSQVWLTNGLVGPGITNGLASTNYANGITNNFTTIVYSNPVTAFTTPTQATNISFALTQTQGTASTNFSLIVSNFVSTNNLAQLNIASNALAGQLAASNTVQAANLLSASNALWLARQPASLTLSNLALTGANTNLSYQPGTNMIATTNLTTGVITFHSLASTGLTNGLSQWVGLQPSAFLSTNVIPSITNGFALLTALNSYLLSTSAVATYYPLSNPSNYVSNTGTNGLATTNFVNTAIGNATNGLATVAQVQSSNTFAILQAATLGSNFGYQIGQANTNLSFRIGTEGTNQSLVIGLAGTNNANSLSNNLTAQFVATNASGITIVSNLVLALQNRAVTNTGPATLGNVVVIRIDGGGTISNSANAYQATNLVGGGILAYSNNITSNNIAGQINVGQVFGAASTVGLLPTVNGNAINLTASNVFSIGAQGQTNFIATRNLIGALGGGQGDGTYEMTGNPLIYTNVVNAGYYVTLSGGNYLVQSNGATLYFIAQGSVPGFSSLGSGTAPAPFISFGSYWNINGVKMIGLLDYSNFVSQVNTVVVGGVVKGIVSSQTFSSDGTNAIDVEAVKFAVGPTNGLSTNSFYVLLAAVTNNIPLGGVVTNINTAALFSRDGTNAIKFIANVINGTSFVGTNLSVYGSAPNTLGPFRPAIYVNNSVNATILNTNLDVTIPFMVDFPRRGGEPLFNVNVVSNQTGVPYQFEYGYNFGPQVLFSGETYVFPGVPYYDFYFLAMSSYGPYGSEVGIPLGLYRNDTNGNPGIGAPDIRAINIWAGTVTADHVSGQAGGITINNFSISNFVYTLAASSSGQRLFVTNCVGIASSFNGFYDLYQDGGYFTNDATGWSILPPGLNPAGITQGTSLMLSNVLAGTNQPYYIGSKATYLGYYQTNLVFPVPTNQPLVSVYANGVVSGYGITVTNQGPSAVVSAFPLTGTTYPNGVVIAPISTLYGFRTNGTIIFLINTNGNTGWTLP